MKIIKLDIEEFDMESGVDKISLVMSPAIEENFMYFNSQQPITDEYIFEKLLEDVISNKYIDDLPQDRQDAILEQLELVGESREELEKDGWIIEEMEEGEILLLLLNQTSLLLRIMVNSKLDTLIKVL
jgi:hypothetical protein